MCVCVSLSGADPEGVARGRMEAPGTEAPQAPIGLAPKARVDSSALGARIEPPPHRGGVWVGDCAPPQKIFRFLSSKRRVLVHSGTDKTDF